MSEISINDGLDCQYCNDGALATDNTIVENIRLAESKLSSDSPYVFYDLNFSDEEVYALNNIKFNNSNLAQLDHFEANSTSSDFKTDLEEFFRKISLNDSDTKTIVNLVMRIFISSENKESEISLLDVRVRSGNIGYGIPHDWHIDDIYQECHYRNFITLIGPSTLFYNDVNVKNKILSGDAEMSEILSLKTESSSTSVKGEYLIDYSKVERARFGQGVLFYQGTNDAALHSGPREGVTTRITLTIDKCDISLIPKILETLAEYQISV